MTEFRVTADLMFSSFCNLSSRPTRLFALCDGVVQANDCAGMPQLEEDGIDPGAAVVTAVRSNTERHPQFFDRSRDLLNKGFPLVAAVDPSVPVDAAWEATQIVVGRTNIPEEVIILRRFARDVHQDAAPVLRAKRVGLLNMTAYNLGLVQQPMRRVTNRLPHMITDRTPKNAIRQWVTQSLPKSGDRDLPSFKAIAGQMGYIVVWADSGIDFSRESAPDGDHPVMVPLLDWATTNLGWEHPQFLIVQMT